jgi:hypothetical protein
VAKLVGILELTENDVEVANQRDQAIAERDAALARAENAESARGRCTGHLVHDEFTSCPVHDGDRR